MSLRIDGPGQGRLSHICSMGGMRVSSKSTPAVRLVSRTGGGDEVSTREGPGEAIRGHA